MKTEWQARDSKLRQKASSSTELSSETFDTSRNLNRGSRNVPGTGKTKHPVQLKRV